MIGAFSMDVIFPITTVLCGCHANVVSLEYLVMDSECKRLGYGLTFLQFAFVAFLFLFDLVSFGRSERHQTKKGSALGTDVGAVGRRQMVPSGKGCTFGPFTLAPRRLRFTDMLRLGIVFWIVSAVNNVIFAFNISIPIHTVFRSSSLLVNVLLGRLFFGKRYSVLQVLCVVLVTAGLIILTLSVQSMSSPVSEADNKLPSENKNNSNLIGIALLAFTVVMSALLGQLQDSAYSASRRHEEELQEKQNMLKEKGGCSRSEQEENVVVDDSVVPRWKEAAFYSHAWSLPLFFLISPAVSSSSSPTGGFSTFVSFGPSGLIEQLDRFYEMPDVHLTLFINILMQYACIRGVYMLTDRTSSLTTTLTITFRKFLSLVFSLFHFGHYQYLQPVHWTALVMVMIGASAFPFLPKGEVKAAPKRKDSKVKGKQE